MAKQHHLVRVDFENRNILTPEVQGQLFRGFQKALEKSDIVIVQDYAKGIFSPDFYKQIIAEAKKQNKKVMVDPHRTYKAAFYEGCDLIKPNWDEAVYLTDFNEEILRRNPEKWVELGHTLMAKTKAKQVVLTKGPDGMFIFEEKKVTHVPTQTRQVYDVTGAGDTAIATISLALSSGVPVPLACLAANLASGVVIAQVGCVPCYASELRTELKNLAELVREAAL
jgi:rfaE bifunctional protein kinase chain/domain